MIAEAHEKWKARLNAAWSKLKKKIAEESPISLDLLNVIPFLKNAASPPPLIYLSNLAEAFKCPILLMEVLPCLRQQKNFCLK